MLTVNDTTNHTINVRIHQLVAEAFLGKRPDKFVVNHKDGNKKNNNINNLEYCTSSQNNQHALNNGLRKAPQMALFVPTGENHYNSKISEEDVHRIIKIREETRFGNRKLSKITGISRGIIDGVIRNRTWKHIERSNNDEQ